MPRIRFLKKQGLLTSNRQHDFTPKQPMKKSEQTEEVVLADAELLTSSASIFSSKRIEFNNDGKQNDEDDFLQVKRRDVFNVLDSATVEVIFSLNLIITLRFVY